MSSPEHRRPYEFSRYIKKQVWRRDQGQCQNLRGCDNAANMVAHITGIEIAKLIGMSRKVARSIDNAELRCWDCESEFTQEERHFTNKLQWKYHPFKL